MLESGKQKLIDEIIAGFTDQEKIWLSGYLAGLAGKSTMPAPAQAPRPAVSRITIAYGTETGNSKKIASDFASRAKQNGIQAKLVSLDQYRPSDLQKEEYFFTVISTQGEGEPPAAAKKFYDHIHNNGFRLEKLKYGVLALGDSAYPLFCKAGQDVDHQLQNLGAERIVTLTMCDTDFEDPASHWFSGVLEKLSRGPGSAMVKEAVAPKKQGGKRVFSGTVLANTNLNDRGSGKQTHHIELSAEGLDYEPGDSIGISPTNSPEAVNAIVALAGVSPERPVRYLQQTFALSELLTRKLNISYLAQRVVAKYGSLVRQEIPNTRMSLVDLMRIYPVKDVEQFEEVLQILEPNAPRLYSISSAPQAHPGEIHLTVARDRFEVDQEPRYGLCSDFLTSLPPEGRLDFYIHPNAMFRLPAPDKDIIMIGPGTGIAPFRSFLAQRDATGATGRNWLFFGAQHFSSDFLYQTEIQSWLATGVLTRASVAFSRDQPEKIYIQDKMRQAGDEFFRWLENGAYVYVCGSKDPMSVDVEEALVDLIKEHRRETTEQARSYIQHLKEEGRYLKDVY